MHHNTDTARPQNAHFAPLSQLLGWAWRASEGARLRVVGLCALGLMRVGLSLGFVWVSKLLIDTAVAPASDGADLWRLAALLIAALVGELLVGQATALLSKMTATRLTLRLRHTLYLSLLADDLYQHPRHTGDLMNRMMVDTSNVVSTVVDFLPSALAMLAQLGAACWLLFAMSPSLAWCALLVTPVCIVCSRLFFRRVRRLNGEIRALDSQVQSQMQEGLQHRLVVQTLECAPTMAGRLDATQRSLFATTRRRALLGLYSRVTMRSGFLAGYLIAFIWSVFQLHEGAITFGIMTAFLQLVGRIQSPISGLAGMLPSLMSTATAVERLGEIDPLAPPPSALPQGAVARPASAGIRVSDLSFAYEEGQPLFAHFSHDFRPGSRTAIMGPTGVGKSTLTKLMLALLTPQQGRVELYTPDGRRRPVGPETRSCFAYVPQGNSLLAGTVRDNLLLARPDASEAELREALRIAVADFVYQLPDALDTPCGELGSRLSEGQCQRIAIARALLREAPIYLFDEFNSSLDNDTATLLRQRLLEARPGATMIFISHKPEIAQLCDETLLLG